MQVCLSRYDLLVDIRRWNVKDEVQDAVLELAASEISYKYGVKIITAGLIRIYRKNELKQKYISLTLSCSL